MKPARISPTVDGADRIACLTSVLDLRLNRTKYREEGFSADLFLFPLRFFIDQRWTFYYERVFYVKLEVISIARNFVCAMSWLSFFAIEEYDRRADS